MARRHKHEDNMNHDRWMISYADFITLLFAFFVVMYSVSSVNEGKYRVLSDSLVSAFHSTPKSLEPIQVGHQSKAAVPTNLKVKIIPDIMISQRLAGELGIHINGRGFEIGGQGGNANGSSLAIISDDVHQAMANLIDTGIISVRRNDLWLEIEINNSILFDSGSALLKGSVTPVIKELAGILHDYPNSIRVEGYTDSKTISTEKFPSNWELSAARAASIARIFELSNILPERLSVVGYGETRPVADNSTEEGRAKNRRAVIVIVANNDIARTVKNRGSGAGVESSGVETGDPQGFDDKAPANDTGATGEIQDQVNTGISDREMSLYRDTVSGELSATGVNIHRVDNTAQGSPIHMFEPIQLPSPFTINNTGHDAKE